MPRPFKLSARWAPRPAPGWVPRLTIVWIALPAVVIVLVGRSCAGSNPGSVLTDQPARVVVARDLAAPGLGTPAERAGIVADMRDAPVFGLLPTQPSPDPELQVQSQVRVEEFADSAVFLYSIGSRANPTLSAITSTETRICQLQSALNWSTVAIGRGEGCIAKNPNGGLFVEWIDRAAKPSLGVHIETTSTDEGRLLAWLSTWQRLPR